jgi:hypothetical protein
MVTGQRKMEDRQTRGFNLVSCVYFTPIHPKIGSVFNAATRNASVTAYAFIRIKYE